MLLVSRAEYTDRTDIIAAAQICIDSYLIEEMKRRRMKLTASSFFLSSDEPLSALALYQVFSLRGTNALGAYLDEAVRRLAAANRYSARFWIFASSSGSAGRFDEVVDLLRGYVTFLVAILRRCVH